VSKSAQKVNERKAVLATMRAEQQRKSRRRTVLVSAAAA